MKHVIISYIYIYTFTLNFIHFFYVWLKIETSRNVNFCEFRCIIYTNICVYIYMYTYISSYAAITITMLYIYKHFFCHIHIYYIYISMCIYIYIDRTRTLLVMVCKLLFVGVLPKKQLHRKLILSAWVCKTSLFLHLSGVMAPRDLLLLFFLTKTCLRNFWTS